MHLEQSIVLASPQNRSKYLLKVTVSKLPTDTAEIHLEFSWPYDTIFVHGGDAKWHNSLAARESLQQVSSRRSGLYGFTGILPAAPTENTFLRFTVYSTETIAVRSLRSLTLTDRLTSEPSRPE